MSDGGDLWLPDDINFSLDDSAALDQLLESLAEPSDEPCASCTSGCGCTSDAATHVVSSGGDSGSRFAPFGGESSGWCHPALCEPDTHSIPNPQEQSQTIRTPQQQQPQQQARGHSGNGSGSDEVMWDQVASQLGSPTHSRTSHASATQAHPDTQLRASRDRSSCAASCHQTVSIPKAAGKHLSHGEHASDKRSSSSCGSPTWSSDCDDNGAHCSSPPQHPAATDATKSGSHAHPPASYEGGANSLLPPGMALAPLQQQSQALLSSLLQQQQKQQPQQGNKQQQKQQPNQQQQQALRHDDSCSKDHSASQTPRQAASNESPGGVQRVAVTHPVCAAASSQVQPAPALVATAECSANSTAEPLPEGHDVLHESATKCDPHWLDAVAPSMFVS